MKTHAKIVFISFTVILLFLGVFSAQAALIQSNQTGNWNTGSTWQGGSVPGSGDTVQILSPDTVTFDRNDSSTTCMDITIDNGGTLEFGTGTYTLQCDGDITINGTLKMKASSTIKMECAADPDHKIFVNATGYLEIIGSQDASGTATSGTSETRIYDTSASWSNDEHNGKVVKMVDGRARGKIYDITDTVNNGSNDYIVRADNSVSDTVSAVSGRRITCNNASTVSANDEHIGRWVSVTSGTLNGNYYLIVNSDDLGDWVEVTDDVQTAGLQANDSFTITDGVASGDSYEITDYAVITVTDTAYETAIVMASGSETYIQYAYIEELGWRNWDSDDFIANDVNGSNANEGLTVLDSEFNEVWRVRPINCSFVTFKRNVFHNAAWDGIYPDGSTNIVVEGNVFRDNGDDCTQFNSVKNSIIKDNYGYNSGNGGEGIYLKFECQNNLVINSTFFGCDGSGFRLREDVTTPFDNVIINGSSFGNDEYGFRLQDTENNIIINIEANSNSNGLYSVDSSNNLFIDCDFGNIADNSTADVTFVDTIKASTLRMDNCSLGSSTEATGVTYSGAYLFSRRHDQSNGQSKIWGEYTIPDDDSSTPTDEGTLKFNYADNLYDLYVTPPTYYGTGTEDTDLQIDLSGVSITQPEVIRAECTTEAANGGTFTITVSGSPGSPSTYDITTGQYTEGTTGVQFTIQDGATDYALGDTYMFVLVPASGDSSTQKRLEFQQANDILTCGSGEEVQLIGSKAARTEIDSDNTGVVAYSFEIIGGTINAQYYRFDSLNTSGLSIKNSGTTVTELSDGWFDNGVTGGSYITVRDFTSTDTFNNNRFDDPADGTDDVSTNVNNPSAGSNINWTFVNWTGYRGGESYDDETGGATITWVAPDNVVNEVLFWPDTGSYEMFSIYNDASYTIHLTGWTFTDEDSGATGFTYTVPQVDGEDVYLAPSDVLYVWFMDGTDDLSAKSLYIGVAENNSLDNAEDQLSAYYSSTMNTQTILDFVQWDTDSSLTLDSQADQTNAVLAGIWDANDYVDVSTYSQGSSSIRSPMGTDTDQPADWALNGTPNMVTLIAFTATGYDSEVVLEWETGAEIDNLGFNLYRSSERIDGDYVQVNNVIISGLDTSEIGGKYLFYDQGVENGTLYYYVLEDLEFDGDSTLHGPVKAAPEASRGEAPAVNEDDYITIASSDDTIVIEDEDSIEENGTGENHKSVTNDIEVVELTDQYMILRITPPAFESEELLIDGRLYHLLSIPGYGHTANPGYPQLPVKGIVLNIALCKEVKLSMLEEECEFFSGFRPLPAPSGEITGDPGDGAFPDGAGIEEYYVEDEAIYQGSSFVPEDRVELGGITLLGERELVNLKINPLQYCGASNEIASTNYMLVRLDFLGMGRPGGGAVDEGIRNETQARLAAAGGYKLHIEEEGIYRVRAEELEGAGFDLPVTAASVQLWRKGQERALHIEGAEDGLFERGDWLEFYAESPGSRYSTQDTYWLVMGDDAGLRMEKTDQKASAPLPRAYDSGFLTRKRAEENRVYLATAGSSDESDRWVWTYAFGMPGWLVPAAATLDLAGVAEGIAETAMLEVGILGFSRDPQESSDHHVLVSFNGEVVGETWFDGMGTEETLYCAVPQELLIEGRNTVIVEALGDTGVAYDIIYLNYVELSYWHRFEAENDELLFSIREDGQYTITGFSDEAITLLDISDPARPIRVVNALIDEQTPGSYSMYFNGYAGRQYRAVSAEKHKSVVELSTDIPSRLHDPDQQADYIIISHADFIPAVERLARYRASQGLTVTVVDIEDVYDEWAYGDMNPQAVHDFLRSAYFTWARPAPEYVLLVGDGSYDYLDYLGRGSRTYIPAHLFKSAFMETASDVWYVDVVGSDLAGEMKIGRLPIHSVEEAGTIIDKIISYETAPYGEGWEKRCVMVADDGNTRPERIFEDTSEELAGIVEDCGFSAERIYLSLLADEQAKKRLLAALNSGVLIANYSGHGARDLWAGEQILTGDDINSLSNTGRLPVVIAMDCLNGYFVDPYGDCLAEAALTSAHGGAIAYWSSTGLTTSVPQAAINKELYRQIFLEGVRELGEAVTRAKLAFAGTAGYEDVLRTWILFGDPALRIHINEPPHAVAAQQYLRARKRESVVLDGSQSWDRDGDTLSYRWAVIDSPALKKKGNKAQKRLRPSYRLRGDDSPYALFEGLRRGRYIVELTVHDSVWESEPALAEVMVRKNTRISRKERNRNRKKARVTTTGFGNQSANKPAAEETRSTSSTSSSAAADGKTAHPEVPAHHTTVSDTATLDSPASGTSANEDVNTESTGTKSEFMTTADVNTPAAQNNALASDYPAQALDQKGFVWVEHTSPVKPGELVSLKKNCRLRKSSQPYDDALIGVISSQPASRSRTADKTQSPPVALAGKGYVRVNGEGGSIQLGDPITSSSTPGVGMKATRKGTIVGYALESKDFPDKNAHAELLVVLSVGIHDPDQKAPQEQVE